MKKVKTVKAIRDICVKMSLKLQTLRDMVQMLSPEDRRKFEEEFCNITYEVSGKFVKLVIKSAYFEYKIYMTCSKIIENEGSWILHKTPFNGVWMTLSIDKHDDKYNIYTTLYQTRKDGVYGIEFDENMSIWLSAEKIAGFIQALQTADRGA
jgi:hypothetical protein